MNIWKEKPTLAAMNARGKNTMVELLGIEFIEMGDDFLRAKMPVDHRTLQPYGIMHGGASCALAESVASIAAGYCIDSDNFVQVGVDINTSHIKQVRSGWVFAKAFPLHLGRTTQVWEIPIENEKGELISMSRIRMAILDKNFGK